MTNEGLNCIFKAVAQKFQFNMAQQTEGEFSVCHLVAGGNLT